MAASWVVWALASAVFAALTAIFAKLGVAEIPADMATLLRTALILVLLAAIVAATGEWVPLTTLSRRGAAFLALSAVATGLSWLCYFRALKLGEATRVAPVDKLSVVLVAVFAALFLGERVSAAHWAGVGLVAAGAALLAFAPYQAWPPIREKALSSTTPPTIRVMPAAPARSTGSS